jgi:hypothetical protein
MAGMSWRVTWIAQAHKGKKQRKWKKSKNLRCVTETCIKGSVLKASSRCFPKKLFAGIRCHHASQRRLKPMTIAHNVA